MKRADWSQGAQLELEALDKFKAMASKICSTVDESAKRVGSNPKDSPHHNSFLKRQDKRDSVQNFPPLSNKKEQLIWSR